MVLVAPSPKLQDQEMGLSVKVSVKLTVWPVTGALGAKVKATVDAAPVVFEELDEEELPPQPKNAMVPSTISNSKAFLYLGMTDLVKGLFK
jgi:hypothetical protein